MSLTIGRSASAVSSACNRIAVAVAAQHAPCRGGIRYSTASLHSRQSRPVAPREDIGHTHRQKRLPDPRLSALERSPIGSHCVHPIPEARKLQGPERTYHWTMSDWRTTLQSCRYSDVNEETKLGVVSGRICRPASCSEGIWGSHRAAILLWSRRKRPAMAGRQPFWSGRTGGVDRNHPVDVPESASKLNTKDLSE